MKAAYALLTLVPSLLTAQVQRMDSLTISINAAKTTRIPANRLTMYVAVEGTAETGVDAQARLNQKLATVSAALQRLGSPVQVEKPVSYGLSPAPMQSYPPLSSAPTYVARSVIRVVATRLDQVGEIQSAAFSAGASSTTGYVFESTLADSTRRALLAEALASAKADAQAMAAAQGVALGPMIEMSSSALPAFQQPTYFNFDPRSSPPAPAPEITVTAQVTVRYRIAR